MKCSKIENLVSIICPCYNHGKYIQYLLNSIIMQSYNNIELIIFDDCSKDNSYKIINNYKKELNKKCKKLIIHKNKKNIGIVKSLNKMLKLSSGKYIKIIASDDVLMPNAIEEFVNFYKKNSSAPFVFSKVKYIDSNNNPLNIIDNTDIVLKNNYSVFDLLFSENFISAPAVFFKRDTFDKFGFFDEKFPIEDYPMWLKISKISTPVFYDKTLVKYRILNTSFSHEIRLLNIDYAKKFVDLYIYILTYYSKYVKNDILKKNGINNKIFFAYKYSIMSLNFYIIKQVSALSRHYRVKINYRQRMYLIKCYFLCLIMKLFKNGY